MEYKPVVDKDYTYEVSIKQKIHNADIKGLKNLSKNKMLKKEYKDYAKFILLKKNGTIYESKPNIFRYVNTDKRYYPKVKI